MLPPFLTTSCLYFLFQLHHVLLFMKKKKKKRKEALRRIKRHPLCSIFSLSSYFPLGVLNWFSFSLTSSYLHGISSTLYRKCLGQYNQSCDFQFYLYTNEFHVYLQLSTDIKTLELYALSTSKASFPKCFSLYMLFPISVNDNFILVFVKTQNSEILIDFLL